MEEEHPDWNFGTVGVACSECGMPWDRRVHGFGMGSDECARMYGRAVFRVIRLMELLHPEVLVGIGAPHPLENRDAYREWIGAAAGGGITGWGRVHLAFERAMAFLDV